MINDSYQKISDDRLMKCNDSSGMISDSFRRLGFVPSDSFFFLCVPTSRFAVYLQHQPDSPVATNLKACNQEVLIDDILKTMIYRCLQPLQWEGWETGAQDFEGELYIFFPGLYKFNIIVFNIEEISNTCSRH